jgi:hypothetical protein
MPDHFLPGAGLSATRFLCRKWVFR